MEKQLHKSTKEVENEFEGKDLTSCKTILEKVFSSYEMVTYYTIKIEDEQISVERAYGKNKGNAKQRALTYYCRTLYKAENSEVEPTKSHLEEQIANIGKMLTEIEDEKLLKDEHKCAIISYSDVVLKDLKIDLQHLLQKSNKVVLDKEEVSITVEVETAKTTELIENETESSKDSSSVSDNSEVIRA